MMADDREREHLPRLPDAADAPTQPLDGVPVGDLPADEEMDLTSAEVTGEDRRLPGDPERRDPDVFGVDADETGYFRYDPDTDRLTHDPPDGAVVGGDGALHTARRPR